MPAKWDLSQVNVHPEDLHMVDPVMDALFKGLGCYDISEKNWIEVYLRFKILEGLYGPFWWREDEESGKRIAVLCTPGDIYSLIGLRTNANTCTRSAFLKSVTHNLESDARRAERDGTLQPSMWRTKEKAE